MTAPREIIPGRYWMVTRRCAQRQFLLRPDDRTNQIFLFCLVLAAQRAGIRVVAFLAMSNHYHAIVYDQLGRLPQFLEHLNKLAARALNARWGRWENFWAAEPPCATHLVNPEDVLNKLLYVLSNPIVDHLVERVQDWPGANSFLAMLSGERIVVQRPREFFRERGPTPPSVTLELARPPGFEAWSQDEWRKFLVGRLSEIEHRTRTDRLSRGLKLLGRKSVLRASAFDSPNNSPPRRNLRPAVACLDVVSRDRALRALLRFRRSYESARQRLAQGQRDSMFPYGTYRMRLIGLRCSGPPS